MNVSFLSRRWRNITWSIIILLIAAVFISLYFYYFIPINRVATNRNGFIILHNIASNIQGKVDNHLKLFKNFYGGGKNKDYGSIKGLLELNNITGTVNFRSPRDTASGRVIDSAVADTAFYLAAINREYLDNVSRNPDKDTLVISESLLTFLMPLLSSQKEELFSSYMLLKLEGKTAKALYEDPEVSSLSSLMVDSLLPKTTQSFTAGIREIQVEGMAYKLFFYPFYAGSHHLVLCGLVNENKYNATLDHLPFYFVFIVATVFLLVIILLPVFKFYIMDSNEVVGLTDFFLYVLSVFIGACVITLIAIQFLLWKGAERQVKENLKDLSDQIGQNFKNQLIRSYNQLTTYDISFANAYGPLGPADQEDINMCFKTVSKEHSYRVTPFYNLSWIDKSGMQKIKVSPSDSSPVKVHVDNRQFFKDVKNKEMFWLPDSSGRKFTWEAVYSQSNSEFTVVVAKPSIWKFAKGDSLIMAAMGAKMLPIVYPLLPAGYSFCIIDRKGEVQIHSDRNRNLRENLFKKMESYRNVQEAVAANQEKYFNEVNFYGRQHLVHIMPIANEPFYLVTFYDKGYIVPINMRVFIFSLVFCFISFLLTSGLAIAIMPKGFLNYPLLYTFKDCLKWIIPQARESQFYHRGLLFLAGYAVAILLLLFLFPEISYVIFSLVIFTPLNVLAGLYIIRSCLWRTLNTQHRKKVRSRKRIWQLLAVDLCMSLLFYYYMSLIAFPVSYHFLLFQGGLIILMALYTLFNKSFVVDFNDTAQKNYFRHYSGLLTALIFCLSGLPAIVYSWYAHKQETVQSVKKHQIYLPGAINERRKSIGWTSRNRNDASSLSTTAFRQNSDPSKRPARVRLGIYEVYKDSIRGDNDCFRDSAEWDVNGKFYYTVADQIANSYYDAQYYPAIADSASDGSWYSKVNRDSSHFWYKEIYRRYPDRGYPYTHITSAIPNYHLLDFSDKGRSLHLAWLFLFSAFSIWLLNRWIAANGELLFLRKYVNAETVNPEDNLIEQFFASNADIGFSLNTVTDDDEKKIDYDDRLPAERRIFEKSRKYQQLYDFIWENCSDKEKYLLVDFAQDELMNHKNPWEIYSLLRKGVFLVDNNYIKLFSRGFRAYLMTRKNEDELAVLRKKFLKNSSWAAFKIPLMVLLLAIAAFIFFTQEVAFQKIIALLAGISSMVTFLPKIYSGGLSGDKKPQ
ncbi:hypothetical protein GZH53_15410 [Flavihumibacter sp. R14]|nr:hypothetical protein [Flavihumibacter soli]